MVSKLYEDYDYNNLGQVSLLIIYLSFGTGNLFSSYVVKRVGYKKSMFYSSLCYVLF
jgi:fucose permease